MYKIIKIAVVSSQIALRRMDIFAMWHSSLMLTDTESAMMRALTSMIS